MAPAKRPARKSPARKRRPTAAERRAAAEAEAKATEAAAREAEKDRTCLELRRAGYGFDAIVAQLGYPDVEVAVSAYERALGWALQPPADRLRELELDRLDRMQTALWTKGMRGDVASIDRLIRLAAARGQVARRDPGRVGPVEARTVVELEQLGQAESALAASATVLARMVDDAESAAGASQAARELRMTMTTLRGLESGWPDAGEGDDAGEGEGTVVPESRLAAVRKKAADRGRE